VLPPSLETHVIVTIITFAVGMAAVVGLERAGREALREE